MTTAELDANWAAAHADHEERLRRVEAVLWGPDKPAADVAPPAADTVPDIHWPAARQVASPPPDIDPTAERFVTLGRALAGTAHDLNNLLAVIHGYAELLTEELPNDPGGEAAVSIRAAADLAGGVVKHLLSVARPSAGTPPRTDVGLHLGRLERLLKAVLTGGPGARLVVEHGCGAAFAAVAPPELTQILLNLTVNAREAMPDGGEVLIRTAVVHQGGPGGPPGLFPGSWVEVVVADTGIGLDPGMQERLADPAGRTAPSGGLGLMTVGDILARCGGHLLLDSTPGAGTRVRVFLPRG